MADSEDGSTPKARRSPRSAGDPDLPVVGVNVRTQRRARRLSLAGLSKESGVSRSMLGQIELGQSVPTITVLLRIARALGVPIDALVTEAK